MKTLISVVVLGIALFSSWSARAQEEEDAVLKWTPEVAMQIREIGDTAISPDNKWVAYTITTPKMEGEDSEFKNTDSSGHRGWLGDSAIHVWRQIQ